MAMAADGRSISDAWPDRFIVGMGVSHASIVRARGHVYTRPISVMRDYLVRVEQAPWSGPKAPLPPLLLAARGPEWSTWPGTALRESTHTSQAPSNIRQVREHFGPEPLLAAELPVVLAGGRIETRMIVAAHTSYYLRIVNYRNTSSGWAGIPSTSTRPGRTSSWMRLSPGPCLQRPRTYTGPLARRRRPGGPQLGDSRPIGPVSAGVEGARPADSGSRLAALE